jgi:hypothetical protein
MSSQAHSKSYRKQLTKYITESYMPLKNITGILFCEDLPKEKCLPDLYTKTSVNLINQLAILMSESCIFHKLLVSFATEFSCKSATHSQSTV